jgi:hypothetical protein
MKHLKVMKLLSALATSKKILTEFQEYDDFNVIELLEMKYEKMFLYTSNPSNNVQ